MNNIIIELSQEDRDRLDRLTATLQEIGSRMPKPITSVAFGPDGVTATTEPAISTTGNVALSVAPKTTPEAPAPAPVAEELPELPVDEPTPFDEAPAEPEAPKPMELAEFQKQIVAMCVAHPEKKAEIQGIVKQYGSRVSAVPEDKRSEVMQKLEALTNG